MNLLQGLSDFWLRFFSDYPLLERFFSGSMDLLAAAYMRFLETVLTLSLRDTPVFRKEFFAPFYLSEEDIFSYGTKTAVDLTSGRIRSFQFLYNKLLDPDVILEKNKDFVIESVGNKTLLLFNNNPFNWDDAGNVIPGVAHTVINNKRYLAFWIPNAEFDAADLFVHYGYLVDRYAPSSEAYKAFLEGFYFYMAVGGPAIPYIKSMLHIIVGLPVARSDELLLYVKTDATKQTIVTDKNTYDFNLLIPLREDILDTQNWGKLRFKVFESFTTIFEVHDCITQPMAFYESILAPQLAPGQSFDRRHAIPTFFENTIDNPSGLIKIGDPGFFIGADDDGYVPTTRPALRHNYGFCVQRILRQNIIYVRVHSQVLVEGVVPFVDFAENIVANIIPGKPVYVLFNTLLPQEFEEQFLVEDRLQENVEIVKSESLLQDKVPFLRIGDFDIGDYYEYNSGVPQIRHYNDDPPETYPNPEGKVPLFIGMESVIIPTAGHLKDMALEIKATNI